MLIAPTTLCTPEKMVAYLDAWLTEAPKGMAQVAHDAGLSRESLYKALSSNGNPSFATILKVTITLEMQFHAQAKDGGV